MALAGLAPGVLERLGSELAAEALMELQYRFPLTATPYCDVADRLGVSVERLLAVLRELREKRILKRVGFYFNYRAARKRGALIAIETSRPNEATRLLLEMLEDVTHSYLRDHPVYNLWVVGKHRDPERIVEAARRAAELYGTGRWLVLWGEKTLRLSVKYDLERGVSRAGPMSKVALRPPRPEDLGYTTALARALRVLPLEPHPYAVIARQFNMSEDEVVAAMKEMLDKGILGDPGAALDGHRLGFIFNGMVTIAPRNMDQLEDLCSWVVDNIEEATHVVKRSATPPGSWRHLCYFMIHAVDEERVKPVLERLSGCPYMDDYMVIKSLEDLLPGVIR
ncbi:hypothetical protein CF15_02905 [Pyrodictium occultum]|uniref:siroheme decarboxylase n=1 Tax=Pyrodictium occultum TaxID=2309 RepID=A0A0V8RUT0_PYROC|nr:Lrp/AsnC family transcriptional regulator [Pyrodictium occultum]KSW11773.1 hypothetical protein CF15_02905 [Pyrodictium occultum]